jgi:hypothetical protein
VLSLLTALEARQQQVILSSDTISDPTSPSTSSSLESLLLSLERTLEKRLSGHNKTDSDLLLELIDLLLTCYGITSSESSPSSSSSLFSPWSKERDLLVETCKVQFSLFRSSSSSSHTFSFFFFLFLFSFFSFSFSSFFVKVHLLPKKSLPLLTLLRQWKSILK